MKNGDPNLLLTTALLTGFVGFAGSASAASLVTNGDFESATGTSPDDWTVAPGTEILDLTGADYIPCCGTSGTTAELDNHFASFGPGQEPNISTLSQAIGTLSGKTYKLSFDAGALGGGTEGFEADVYDSTHTVLLQSLTFTNTANDALGGTFGPHSLNFTAIGGSILSFHAIGGGSNINSVLDNVSVSAVPEPATWAVMLIGLGGVGAALRRRRTPGLARV